MPDDPVDEEDEEGKKEASQDLADSKNEGPCLGSPYNKDHNVFGPILGPTIYTIPYLLQKRFIDCCRFGAGRARHACVLLGRGRR